MMTNNPNNKSKPTIYTWLDPVKQILEIPDYSMGRNQKQLDLRSVRGLEPKYCYATLSSAQTVTNWSRPIINFNVFSTNDQSMSSTNWRIIIPKKWLYTIIAQATYDSLWWWIVSHDIKKNWSYDLWDAIVSYYVWESKAWVTSPNRSELSCVIFLEKWDYIQLEVFQDSWSSKNWFAKPYTQLRVISYVYY